MPTLFFPITIVTQVFEDETRLAEALGFAEVSRFDSSAERLVQAVRANVEEILKRAEVGEIQNRLAPESVEQTEIWLKIEAPRSTKAWREPINLKFDVLRWQREDGYCQAIVPALGIAVLTKNVDEFEQKITDEIRAALTRSDATKSLFKLRLLERVQTVKVDQSELAVTIKTPKQRALEAENEPEEKSILEQVGTKLNEAKLIAAYEVEIHVEQLAENLSSKQTRSVLLIGKSGAGKTAIMHELVRQRAKFGFRDTEFWATSGARLVAGQTGFGMWQERCQKLVAEAKKQNAVLHLGNLIELLEVGKSASNSQGIASFFRPKLARGEIQIVAECTPEQLSIIEKLDPNLLGAFQQLRIEEPTREVNFKILQSVAREFAPNDAKKEAITFEAIETLGNVHNRYATYSAFPGRPVRFLRNLLSGQNLAEPLISSEVLQAFSEETGLPLVLLSDEARLDLNKTENWFGHKVLGQPEAVRLVVDLIATVKARLVRPRKPIASLLFIGPTGVGKTELTKALAEFFFRDAARMVRFDMSEYASALAVQRLIGGTGEAEGQLTARLREQPFSIVLFDEFEKADASFFDLLLQILGEGRLTDASGRTADFTNSIIVMTSNLGAADFRRGKSGFVRNAREKTAAIKHFTAAVRDFLRPEIFNRLDRIVPFAPLDEETALVIVRLELEKLKKRDGLRFRAVNLNIEPDVVHYLAEKGYDARYGARPLRRAIERELLAPLATELNRRSIEEKLDVLTSLPNGKIHFAFESNVSQKKRVSTTFVLASLAERAASLRRKTQKLLASSHLTELEDEKFQLTKTKDRMRRGRWLSPEDAVRLERLPKIKRFLESAASFGEIAARIEDQIALEIYGKAASVNSEFNDELIINELRFDKVLLDLLTLKFAVPNEICLEIYGENSAALFRMVRAYLVITEEFGGEVAEVLVFTSERQPDENSRVKTSSDLLGDNAPVVLFNREIWRQEILKPEEFFANAKKEIVSVMLRLRCELANPRFAGESGLHAFSIGGQTSNVLVQSGDFSFREHVSPNELSARDSVKNQAKRRVYDKDKLLIKDFKLKKDFDFDGVSIVTSVKQAINENLERTAEKLIE